jgi:hypothetical protein
VIAITKFYVVVDVAFKVNSEITQREENMDLISDLSNCLDFGRKWPEIAISIEI